MYASWIACLCVPAADLLAAAGGISIIFGYPSVCAYAVAAYMHQLPHTMELSCAC
jgi:hypothetical protein